jgi:hypothetical protein
MDDDQGVMWFQQVGQWERLELEADPQYLAWVEAQEQEYRQCMELEPA